MISSDSVSLLAKDATALPPDSADTILSPSASATEVAAIPTTLATAKAAATVYLNIALPSTVVATSTTLSSLLYYCNTSNSNSNSNNSSNRRSRHSDDYYYCSGNYSNPQTICSSNNRHKSIDSCAQLKTNSKSSINSNISKEICYSQQAINQSSVNPLPKSSSVTEIKMLNTEWSEIEIVELINEHHCSGGLAAAGVMSVGGGSLGFSLMGSKSTGVVIRSIFPGSPADKNGRLRVGDHLMYIDDINVRGMTSEQIASILRQCGDNVRLIVARPIYNYSGAGADPILNGSYTIIPTEQIDQHLEFLVHTLLPVSDMKAMEFYHQISLQESQKSENISINPLQLIPTEETKVSTHSFQEYPAMPKVAGGSEDDTKHNPDSKKCEKADKDTKEGKSHTGTKSDNVKNVVKVNKYEKEKVRGKEKAHLISRVASASDTIKSASASENYAKAKSNSQDNNYDNYKGCQEEELQHPPRLAASAGSISSPSSTSVSRSHRNVKHGASSVGSLSGGGSGGGGAAAVGSDGASGGGSSHSRSSKVRRINSSENNVFEEYVTQLTKGDNGLGLTIAGYITCRPEVNIHGIFVKSITKGSAADLDGKVAVNDQIIEINDNSVIGFDNPSVVDILKKTTGTVKLKFHRYTKGPIHDILTQTAKTSTTHSSLSSNSQQQLINKSSNSSININTAAPTSSTMKSTLYSSSTTGAATNTASTEKLRYSTMPALYNTVSQQGTTMLMTNPVVGSTASDDLLDTAYLQMPSALLASSSSSAPNSNTDLSRSPHSSNISLNYDQKKEDRRHHNEKISNVDDQYFPSQQHQHYPHQGYTDVDGAEKHDNYQFQSSVPSGNKVYCNNNNNNGSNATKTDELIANILPGSGFNMMRMNLRHASIDKTIEDTIKSTWNKIIGTSYHIIIAYVSKSNDGLGISLEGTVDVDDVTGTEDRPRHYLRTIVEEGPVGQCGVFKPGDELLEVNGKKLYGVPYQEVLSALKTLPNRVQIVCARRKEVDLNLLSRSSSTMIYDEFINNLYDEDDEEEDEDFENEDDEDNMSIDVDYHSVTQLEELCRAGGYGGGSVLMRNEILQRLDLAVSNAGNEIVTAETNSLREVYKDPMRNPIMTKAKSDNSLFTATNSSLVSLLPDKSITFNRSLQYLRDVAMWSGPILVELNKESHGLGFSIDYYQDPIYHVPVIVISTLVPKGTAHLDGRIIPGDRLLFINEVEVDSLSSKSEVIDVLRSLPRGKVLLGIAKPIFPSGNMYRSYSKETVEEKTQTTNEEENEEKKDHVESLKRWCFIDLGVTDIALDTTKWCGVGYPVLNREHKHPVTIDPYRQGDIITDLNGQSLANYRPQNVALLLDELHRCKEHIRVGYIPSTEFHNWLPDYDQSVSIPTQRIYKCAPDEDDDDDDDEENIEDTEEIEDLEESLEDQLTRGSREQDLNKNLLTNVPFRIPSYTQSDNKMSDSSERPQSSEKECIAGWSSPRRVILYREPNQSLGISILGGKVANVGDNEDISDETNLISGIFITQVTPGSPAYRCGQLNIGDRLLSVNGNDLIKASYDDAIAFIKNATSPIAFTVQSLIDISVVSDAQEVNSNAKESVDILTPTDHEQEPCSVNIKEPPTELKEKSAALVTPTVSTEPAATAYFTTPPNTPENIYNTTSLLPEDKDNNSFSVSSLSNESVTAEVSEFETQEIVIEKQGSKGLGLLLVGNKDCHSMNCYICGFKDNSVAILDGRLRVGDELLKINSIDVHGMSHSNVAPIIKKCQTDSDKITLTIRRRPSNVDKMACLPGTITVMQSITSNGGKPEFVQAPPPISELDKSTEDGKSSIAHHNLKGYGEIHRIYLERSSHGFGFFIMDGNANDETGIYVKKITSKGIAAQEGTLKEGDRILLINDEFVANEEYDGVLKRLRSCEGYLDMVIGRITTVPNQLTEARKMSMQQLAAVPNGAQPVGNTDKMTLSAPKLSLSNRANSFDEDDRMDNPPPLTSEIVASPVLQFLEDGRKVSNATWHNSALVGVGSGVSVNVNANNSSSSSGIIRKPKDYSQDDKEPIYSSIAPDKKRNSIQKVTASVTAGKVLVYPTSILTSSVSAATAFDTATAAAVVASTVSSTTTAATPNTTTTTVTKKVSLSDEKPKEILPAPQKSSLVQKEHPTKAKITPGQETVIELSKDRGLGLSIVGGSDTILGTVMIHEVHENEAAALDGRLWAGDRILAVNGKDLRNATHDQAIQALRSVGNRVRLKVFRDPKPLCEDSLYFKLKVDLIKKSKKGLGICIVSKSDVGVCVSDLVKGSIAEQDGRLRKGDLLLEINDVNIRSYSQDQVAALLKRCSGNVSLMVGRLRSTIYASDTDGKRSKKKK